MGMSNFGTVAAKNHHRILVDMLDGFFASGSMSTDGVLTLSKSMTEKVIKILSERELSDASAASIQRELMSG